MGSLTEAERLEELPLLTCHFPTASTVSPSASTYGVVEVCNDATVSLTGHELQTAALLYQNAWGILLRAYTREDRIAFAVSKAESQHLVPRDDRGGLNDETSPRVEYCCYEISAGSLIGEIQPLAHIKYVSISRVENHVNTAVRLWLSKAEFSKSDTTFSSHISGEPFLNGVSCALYNWFYNLG